MIRAIQIIPGDRIGVRENGRVYTRTVISVGTDYVTIHVCGKITKVPEHRITSMVKVDKSELRGGRYGV